MTSEQRTDAFVSLGRQLAKMEQQALEMLCMEAQNENPWFTPDNMTRALKGIIRLLDKDKLHRWLSAYDFSQRHSKAVGIVMAGNIPFVGFHDLLSVLISGHGAIVKLSSKDSKSIRMLVDLLIQLEPEFRSRIVITNGTLQNMDAIIATGSTNTSRYFTYYFSKYPHIIRKNRTSCAVLTGNESPEELRNLGEDIFSFFGLGCRNVSKIYLPRSYRPENLIANWDAFKTIIHHHKYANNYDYQKSILLVNKLPHLDAGFVLLQENERLVSPIAILFYEYYDSLEELRKVLASQADQLQCVVGQKGIGDVPLGQAQYPEVWDYADQIDTLKFLTELR